MNQAMGVSCRKAFTDTLLELAKRDKDIIVVTTDARGSVTLNEFAEQLPGQFIEIGIAEQNSVGIGAGLALCGTKVFVCGPASFLSARSLEQVKVDVAYSNANVKVIGVSGGVSYGALGASHHSLHDIAVMRAIPGITVMLPCDAAQTRKMTRVLADFDGPVYVRMGRNPVPDVYISADPAFEPGKSNLLMDGSDIAIIGTGETVRHALDAAVLLKKKGIHARVIDMHTIKPFDRYAVIKAAEETGYIITVEEHSIHGGLGAAVSETIVQNKPVPMRILGIPDDTVITGTSPEVFKHYGLTGESICNAAEDMLIMG
jgi:transketolase